MGGRIKYKYICKKKQQKNRIRTLAPNKSTMEKKGNNTLTAVDKQATIDSTIEETKMVQHENVNTRKETESYNKGSESNRKESLTKYLWSGVLGALVTLVLLVLVAFFIPGFRYSSYYVNEDPSQLTRLLSSNLSEKDSLNVAKAIVDETARRKDVIEDLLDQRIIVSSEDFASNLSGYYNALIAVLAAVLVILNLFGFFAWRSNASEALEQEKRKLSNEIENIDDRLENNLEDILRKNQVVKEKLVSYFLDLIDQANRLEDDEWEKLRLLLKKYEYKKKEVLVEIETNKDDNDGSIVED